MCMGFASLLNMFQKFESASLSRSNFEQSDTPIVNSHQLATIDRRNRSHISC